LAIIPFLFYDHKRVSFLYFWNYYICPHQLMLTLEPVNLIPNRKRVSFL